MLVRDAARHVYTEIHRCRSCGQAIYFSLTSSGKRAPFEVDADDQPTRINHFSKCTDPKRWRKVK